MIELEKPQMGVAAKYIEEFIDTFSGSTLHVLEWGSGSSTIYFARYLQKRGIDFTWLSLEYNRDWFENVSNKTEDISEVELILFDSGNDKIHQIHTDMEDYIMYPATLGKRFDLIIIDGRKRRRCLLEARNLISEDGAVYLHDAFRLYYWSALKRYPSSKFLYEGLWEGRIQKPTVFVLIQNKIGTFFIKIHCIYRYILKSVRLKMQKIYRNLSM